MSGLIAAWARLSALAAAGGAALLGYIEAGARAVLPTLEARLRDTVSAAGYGFLPGATAAANTAALGLIATAMNARGGGDLVIPPGVYNVTVPKAGIACSFANLTGIRIIASGVTIADGQAYVGAEVGKLFNFSACKNFSVSPGLNITAEAEGANVRGTYAFYLTNGCFGFDISWEQTGGLAGVFMNRAPGGPYPDRCSHYKLSGKTTNVHYPVTGAFSGDDGAIKLNNTGAVRDFLFYGAQHVKLTLVSTNTTGTALIAAYNGFGCTDFQLRYYDRASTAHIDLPRVQLCWNDATAASHIDIDLHFEVQNVAGSAGVEMFGMYKLNKAAAPDSTGQGHHLENLTISGVSNQIAGCKHIGTSAGCAMNSTGGTPDVVKNILVKQAVLTGSTIDDDWSFVATALTDKMVFDHVNHSLGFYIANGTHGRVIFQDCTAPYFSANGNGALSYGDTGAAKVLLDSKIAAASATIAFPGGLTPGFGSYEIEISDLVCATDNSDLWLRFSENAGGAYQAGGGGYVWQSVNQVEAGAPAGVGAADTKILLASNLSNAEPFSTKIVISNPWDQNYAKMVQWHSSYVPSGSSIKGTKGEAVYAVSVNPVNAIQFLMSAGNITHGYFSLYGIRKG